MNEQTKHTSMFLLELIIAILFFCMASAVCIQLFVKSRMLSRDTGNLNMALNQVTMAAEVFRSGTEMREFLKQEFPAYGEGTDGTEFFLYYNKEWESCTAKEADFCLRIKILDKGRKKEGSFSMIETDAGKEIYSVSVETITGK